MENIPFGPHLTLDLSGCPEDILADLPRHFRFLKELPEALGMTAITQPYVFPYSGLVPEDEGITGVTIIAESHCSIHSFQRKGYSFIDIFSCKPVDMGKVIPIVQETFQPSNIVQNLVQRGLDFPRY